MKGVKLVVAGAGGHGSEVFTYVQDLIRRGWEAELLGYLDDGVPPGLHRNMNVLGRLDRFAGCPPDFFRNLSYLTALGNNFTRRQVAEAIESLYGPTIWPWTLIHPAAYIGDDVSVSVGAGSCVAPGAVITSRVRIGRHCILNVKASVSHDCVIGDFVNVNPSATVCGNVTVGDGAFIGAGATLIDKVNIGRGAVIGAGAVVVKDIPPDVTAVGIPARVIKHNRESF